MNVRETGNQLILMKKGYHLGTCPYFVKRRNSFSKSLNIIIVIPSELFALRSDIAVGEISNLPETFIDIRVGGLPFLDFGE